MSCHSLINSFRRVVLTLFVLVLFVFYVSKTSLLIYSYNVSTYHLVYERILLFLCAPHLSLIVAICHFFSLSPVISHLFGIICFCNCDIIHFYINTNKRNAIYRIRTSYNSILPEQRMQTPPLSFVQITNNTLNISVSEQFVFRHHFYILVTFSFKSIYIE